MPSTGSSWRTRTRSGCRRRGASGVYPAHLSNRPVWTMPPEEADAYTRWLAERAGRAFRLSTEAEWEYAASGGDGREYPGEKSFARNVPTPPRRDPLEAPVGIYPDSRAPFGCPPDRAVASSSPRMCRCRTR
ncbi:SUMF1/EgtB/PvdO family nonheme iron enzyme (plasmid) [Streptomyces sp. BB1-1-1]|nr:SUMF1/EgtB/PvdO family nonheme iron enzyme [Streptomyces sp. BB1-1-1]WND40874.1 SUMF1/EgtB/PvdO family nonheme iron enzyme [Streptomyces sp. BB1-1-1]